MMPSIPLDAVIRILSIPGQIRSFTWIREYTQLNVLYLLCSNANGKPRYQTIFIIFG